MPKLPHVSGAEIQRALERLGFQKARQSGSHVVMKRDTKGCVVPLHDEVKIGTFAGLLRQAQVGAFNETAVTTAAAKPTHVATPGDATQPVLTGQPNVPQQPAKTTKVIRAAELSSETYMETEVDVDAYVSKLKSEMLAAVRAGQIVRVQ